MRPVTPCGTRARPWIGALCCVLLSSAPAFGTESAPGARAVTDPQSPMDSALGALAAQQDSRIDPLSCGFVPHIVERGQIQLPVDDWTEAKAIASAWLDAVGDPTLRLGQGHQLDRAYVVTIVDGSDGQRLRHQIVIGVQDGRVAVL